MAAGWVGDIARKRVIPAILAEPRSSLYGLVTRDVTKAEAYPGVAAWVRWMRLCRMTHRCGVYRFAGGDACGADDCVSEGGKHVLCEKPVAMNFAQAETMARGAAGDGAVAGGVAIFGGCFRS